MQMMITFVLQSAKISTPIDAFHDFYEYGSTEFSKVDWGMEMAHW